MVFSKIKFVLSEIDGVITEHMSAIGEMGITLFKTYYMKDFDAINLIKKEFGFAFISKDADISMSLCKKKNLAFFYAERDKREMYQKVLRRYSLSPDNVLYIGNNYSDVACMKLSGISICPEDAVVEAKNVSDIVVPDIGGTGVICSVYELLKSEIKDRLILKGGPTYG